MNEDACEDLVSRLPLLDGFVSNAGIGKMLPLQFYSLEVLDEVFRINCFSPMLLLKLLVKRKRLKIILLWCLLLQFLVTIMLLQLMVFMELLKVH